MRTTHAQADAAGHVPGPSTTQHHANPAHHVGDPAATPGHGEDGPRWSWAVLAIALAAQVLVVLDISVVNTALPFIGADLHLSGSDLQWLVTAYLMMSGGGLLLGGRIADLMSRKVGFLVGLALFTGASILSGFAGSAGQLTATRNGLVAE